MLCFFALSTLLVKLAAAFREPSDPNLQDPKQIFSVDSANSTVLASAGLGCVSGGCEACLTNQYCERAQCRGPCNRFVTSLECEQCVWTGYTCLVTCGYESGG